MSIVVTSAISIISLLVGFYFFKKASKSKGSRITFFIIGLLTILFSVSYLAIDYFTDSGVNEAVVYHLKYGLEGAGFFEYKELIFMVAGILVVGLGLLFIVTLSKDAVTTNTNVRTAFILLFIALLLNPLFVSIFQYQVLQTESANFDEY